MSEKKHVLVSDPATNVTYKRERFLGKGKFAKCYLFRNVDTNELYAGKVIPKSSLLGLQDISRLTEEIKIHKTLSHPYIVKFHSNFSDKTNIYMILELCKYRTLMEMHARRGTLTMQEVRYFMHQIALACRYLHEKKVIHRDLKLGNLLLSKGLVLKVGDFGFATVISHVGELKKTACGTPNYIAPEILKRKGHSFAADIWSIGCIMYTLLIGTPPFETLSMKNTYRKIKKNEYSIPAAIECDARNLIKRLLHPKAECRPTSDQILVDPFLTNCTIPASIPTSCLIKEPKCDKITQTTSKTVAIKRPLMANQDVSLHARKKALISVDPKKNFQSKVTVIRLLKEEAKPPQETTVSIEVT